MRGRCLSSSWWGAGGLQRIPVELVFARRAPPLGWNGGTHMAVLGIRLSATASTLQLGGDPTHMAGFLGQLWDTPMGVPFKAACASWTVASGQSLLTRRVGDNRPLL